MANFPELQVRRRLLGEYISRSAKGTSGVEEVVISLLRPVITKTETGGVSQASDPIELPPQTFALMPFKRRQTDETVMTAPSTGRDEVTSVQFLLISPVKNDVEKGDYFIWTQHDLLRPGEYKVEYVAIRRHDRKLVGIYYHGPGS